jgi:CRISPR system Cascade subunit CasD
MADPQVHTLLIRLVGPMQSWGTSSRYSVRDSGGVPSKSGVVGILAAALGRSRSDSVDDIAALRMGVRVDCEGVPGYDFQTAGAAAGDPGIAKSSDTPEEVSTRLRRWRAGTLTDSARGRPSISRRHFLHDAAFLVGLEGPDLDQLQELDRALLHPKFAIGLGRRSYVPSLPLALPGGGVRVATGLIEALERAPWPSNINDPYSNGKSPAPMLRGVIEARGEEQAALLLDQPIGAAFANRTFGLRPVYFTLIVPHSSSGGNTQ